MKQISEGWRQIKRERRLKKLKLVGTIILGLLLFSLWVAVSSLDRPSFAKEQREELTEKQIRPVVILTEVKIPPILEKISFCESSGKHFDGNGEVLRGEIDPRDTGKFQISSFYFGDAAEAIELDLEDPEDNEKMALWIFNNYGSVPWVKSFDCWNRL